MIFEGVDYPYEVVNRAQADIGRIHIVKDTIKIGGELFPYTFTTHKNSVCIFPVFENKIVAIKQYRHTVNEWLWEIPCGSIDEGETPEQAAKRELLEETGFIAGELIDLGEYWENIGISRIKGRIFFTKCIEKKDAHLETTEFIETKLFSFAEFCSLVKENEFHLLIGLVAWFKANEEGLIDYKHEN